MQTLVWGGNSSSVCLLTGLGYIAYNEAGECCIGSVKVLDAGAATWLDLCWILPSWVLVWVRGRRQSVGCLPFTINWSAGCGPLGWLPSLVPSETIVGFATEWLCLVKKKFSLFVGKLDLPQNCVHVSWGVSYLNSGAFELNTIGLALSRIHHRIQACAGWLLKKALVLGQLTMHLWGNETRTLGNFQCSVFFYILRFNGHLDHPFSCNEHIIILKCFNFPMNYRMLTVEMFKICQTIINITADKPTLLKIIDKSLFKHISCKQWQRQYGESTRRICWNTQLLKVGIS